MSAPIGALAVMDAGADALTWPAAGMERRKKAAKTLREARTAFAELVTKATALADAAENAQNQGRWLGGRVERIELRAALAKIASAPAACTCEPIPDGDLAS